MYIWGAVETVLAVWHTTQSVSPRWEWPWIRQNLSSNTPRQNLCLKKARAVHKPQRKWRSGNETSACSRTKIKRNALQMKKAHPKTWDINATCTVHPLIDNHNTSRELDLSTVGAQLKLMNLQHGAISYARVLQWPCSHETIYICTFHIFAKNVPVALIPKKDFHRMCQCFRSKLAWPFANKTCQLPTQPHINDTLFCCCFDL